MSSSPDLTGLSDPPRPTERTPLLPSHGSSQSVNRAEGNALPHIGVFAANMTLEDLPTYSVENLYPQTLSSRPAQTAFALCVLLYYRKSIAGDKSTRGRDVWTQWREKTQHLVGIRDLDTLALRVWTEFLEDDGTAEDVENVLWSAYPIEPSSTVTVRVVDFLADGDALQDLSRHSLIYLSLLDTWKYGSCRVNGGASASATLLRFLDRCGTPRVLHIVDLLMHIIYLCVLFYYINWPPSYALFGSFTFTLLLLAFYWEIVLLHFPVLPSPLLLASPDVVLPLSTLARRSLSRLIVPAVFFIPGLFVSFFMLQLEMTPFFARFGPGLIPTDRSATYLLLFTTFLFFLYCATIYSMLVHPFLAVSQGYKPDMDPWDRYTESVGLEARKGFFHAVRRYGTAYYFPTPFNLVQVLAVRIPRLMLVTFRRSMAAERITALDKALWRVISPPTTISYMSTRRKAGRQGGQPPAKRRRTDIGHWQPEDEDIATGQAQTNVPSAAALSERVLPLDHVPTLSNICIRVFADNLQALSKKETVWETIRLSLKGLPDALSQRVFTALRHTCPTLLQHGFIVANFLRGNAVALGDDLPGVSRLTIFAIGDMSTKDRLQELELTGLAKIPDATFATAVSMLPNLRKLNLRGCTKVGQETVKAAAEHCQRLEIVNLNYTAVTPLSLAPLLLICKQLATLKVAGIPNWLWSALPISDGFQLSSLRSLKLRQAALSDAVLNPTLAICPNLERLDLSFTLVKRPVLPLGHSLEKIVLTSTKISSSDLLAMMSPLTRLKVLAIGAMGGGQGSSAAISNTSAMTLTDETLRSLTDILGSCPDIERVNLVGNTKLGFTGRRGPDAALAYFVRKVGRRCKHLNLAGITSLRSSDLEGLAHPDGLDDGPPQLDHLNLNNTSVDDTAAPYISACTQLQTLELASTKFSSAGLFPIIDACERLVKLDLTSCRGVRVGDRRRFFEVWEEEWRHA
ncbi:RNI-like protein [Cubamyces sp. BRFM 1775]|nr:RNI-like protein [Cubamyces sp. BRFM 1775]